MILKEQKSTLIPVPHWYLILAVTTTCKDSFMDLHKSTKKQKQVLKNSSHDSLIFGRAMLISRGFTLHKVNLLKDVNFLNRLSTCSRTIHGLQIPMDYSLCIRISLQRRVNSLI